MHPARLQISCGVKADKPDAKEDSQEGAWGHDHPEEFFLHGTKAGPASRIRGFCMIDKEPRQVKKTREPCDHKDNMQGHDPEHLAISIQQPPYYV